MTYRVLIIWVLTQMDYGDAQDIQTIFAEQSIWVVLYFFSISAGVTNYVFFNWTSHWLYVFDSIIYG